MKKKKAKRSRRLFTRLFTRMLVVLSIIVGVYFLVLTSNLFRTTLRDSTHDAFKQRVDSSAQSVMQQLWRYSNLNDAADALNETLSQQLAQRNADVDEIADNPVLNQRLLESMYPQLEDLIHQQKVDDVFLILNGVGREDSEENYAVLYLRSTNPVNYSADNSDLLLRAGSSAIAREHNLALDSSWQQSYLPDMCPSTDFFDKPRQAYMSQEGVSTATASAWGYWSTGHKLYAQDTADTITYSVPLYTGEDKLWGVLGVGVMQHCLSDAMGVAELGDGGGAWLLATQDGNSLHVLWTTGDAAYTAYLANENLTIQPLAGLDTYRVNDVAGIRQTLAAAVAPLSLYAVNSPYGQGNLVLAAVTPMASLDRAATQVIVALGMLGSVTWVIGMLGIAVTSWSVSRPMTCLAGEIEKMNPGKELHLPRTGVREIDLLTEAVEKKNAEAIASASRFSEIASMTGELFGVFECKCNADKVFIAGDLVHMMGFDPEERTAEMDCAEFEAKMRQLFRDRLSREERVFRMQMEDGAHHWVRLCIRNNGGDVRGVVTDVTMQVDRRLKLDYEHAYDVLTDLMNNRAFQERLRQTLFQPAALGKGILIMWDLDNLKEVNDTYGHESGDSYIHVFANWLKTITGASGFSARRSGDEFFTFLYGFENDEKREAFLRIMEERMSRLTGEVYGWGEVPIAASAGAARYPEDAVTPVDLMHCADAAMYTAKRAGKGRIVLYDAQHEARTGQRLSALDRLNRLIHGQLVQFAYQPVLRLKDAKVVGYEMLMRPTDKDFANPLEVLSAAKSLGMLYQVEKLTVFGAVRQAVRDCESGKLPENCRLLINSIANECLTQEDFEELLAIALPRLDHRVVLEVTEGEPMNMELMARKRALLRSLHGSFALDDYGTGYNGRTSLLTLYPEMIKLDRSLVHNLDTDSYRQTFLKQLVAFANERGMLVMAEGVETEAELRMAASLGAGYAQGYFVAEPSVEPPEVPEQVKRIAREAAAMWKE